MNLKAPTHHISAQPGEIAKTVIMPGDPLRAKFIAENFLEDVVMVNFIGPLIKLSGILSLAGIIIGLVKKNKKIFIISSTVFAIIALIFILEALVLE